MEITGFELFYADGAYRPFSFLKLSTDAKLAGWSEFVNGPWAPALPQIIEALIGRVVGMDPRKFDEVTAELVGQTRFASGGVVRQAIAAIENACIDIAAKAEGVPVADLFGGRLRDDISLYWTHCGSFRVAHERLLAPLLGYAPLTSAENFERIGEEVARRGFGAAKTNPVFFDSEGARMGHPGFGPGCSQVTGSIKDEDIEAIVRQMSALRKGAGPDIGLMLDVNFSYNASAVSQLAKALEPLDLHWIESDGHRPEVLLSLKESSPIRIASLEALHGEESYHPYQIAGSVDVVIVDVIWNGFAESFRIASESHSSGMKVAPHNFYGPISDLIAAQFCSILPNLELMECEVDDVPWKHDLLTATPQIGGGRIIVPTGPGWGADIDEEALERHGWRRS